jgi:hypothetical protein
LLGIASIACNQLASHLEDGLVGDPHRAEQAIESLDCRWAFRHAVILPQRPASTRRQRTALRRSSPPHVTCPASIDKAGLAGIGHWCPNGDETSANRAYPRVRPRSGSPDAFPLGKRIRPLLRCCWVAPVTPEVAGLSPVAPASDQPPRRLLPGHRRALRRCDRLVHFAHEPLGVGRPTAVTVLRRR